MSWPGPSRRHPVLGVVHPVQVGVRSAAAAVTTLLLAASSSLARTWNVYADGTGDAPTIQAASDSAAAGDSILVHSGTYFEQVTIADDVISLIGVDGADMTTVDAAGIGNCLASFGSGTLVKGLHLVGAEQSYGFGGYGLYSGAETQVEECLFDNAEGAIWAEGSLTVTDSEIADNTGIFFGGTMLQISGCLFRDNDVNNGGEFLQAIIQLWWRYLLPGTNTVAEITNNAFEHNLTLVSERPVIGWDTLDMGDLDLLLERNLFVNSGGPAVGVWPLPVTSPRGTAGGSVALTVRGNTIVRGGLYSLGTPAFALPAATTIEANSITGNGIGVALPNEGVGFVVSCNNSWGNNGQDWVGFPDPTGIDGNISEPPKYCGAPMGDFTVATNSPLLPQNNSCGVQIGAFGAGCGPVSIEELSWGRIKSIYRGDVR